VYFLEVGVLLILVPWSPFWDRNYFLDRTPRLRHLAASYYVRGGVSGLGAVNVAMGLADLAALVGLRRVRPEPGVAVVDEIGPGLAGEEWRSRGAR
jgi:hypothetical protein